MCMLCIALGISRSLYYVSFLAVIYRDSSTQDLYKYNDFDFGRRLLRGKESAFLIMVFLKTLLRYFYVCVDVELQKFLFCDMIWFLKRIDNFWSDASDLLLDKSFID